MHVLTIRSASEKCRARARLFIISRRAIMLITQMSPIPRFRAQTDRSRINKGANKGQASGRAAWNASRKHNDKFKRQH